MNVLAINGTYRKGRTIDHLVAETTPMYDANVTAVMKCFLERMSWVMARPGHRPFEGCPEPRHPGPKAAVYITSTGKGAQLVGTPFLQRGPGVQGHPALHARRTARWLPLRLQRGDEAP